MNARSRLPLNALRVLEAVGKHGSLVEAAQALNVEPSAVSMQMKSLADFIGAPLLRRVGRGVELTAVALQLLPSVSAGLQQIEEALRSASRGSQRDFHLSVLPSFLLLWLLPRVPALTRLSASFGRNLVVSVSKGLVDLRSGDYDAAIRLGAGRWPGLHAVKLLDETLIPVCSPELSRRVGTVQPGQLPTGAALLASRLDPWARWANTEATTDQSGLVMLDDAVAIILAAERGMGVALARGALAHESLQGGRLVSIGPALPYRHAYHWVCSQSGADDALGSAILKALRREASASPPHAPHTPLAPLAPLPPAG